MKKNILFCIAALLLCSVLTSCVFTNVRERGIETAEEIAREEFGMSTIYTIDNAPRDIADKIESSYCMAVIGEKDDGEELFLIVPGNYDTAPFLAPWPFVLSFKEMVAFLNETVGETVISAEDYGAFGNIELSNIAFYLPDVDLSLLDFPYMVCNTRSHYLLAQADGEIVIYDTQTQQPYAPLADGSAASVKNLPCM